MKIVINGDFGGFGYGIENIEFRALVDRLASDRENPELVAFVKNHPEDCGDLVIATIPDNATDYVINENDGLETLIYVVDGIIHFAYGDEDEEDYEDDEEDYS